MKPFDFTTTQSNFSFRNLLIFLISLGLIYVAAIFFLSNNLPEAVNYHVNDQAFSEFEVDDLGCNGYSMDVRIETQKRILESIRSEIFAKAREIDSITSKYEALSKLIVDRKNELDGIELEIEVARRELRDWSDRRNVRVSLPHSPLETPKFEIETNTSRQTFRSLEEAVDFSRCSITKFFRIYVYPVNDGSSLSKKYYEELTRLDAYTNHPESACFYVILADNEFRKENYALWNGNGRNHLVLNIGKKNIYDPTSAALLMEEQVSKFSSPLQWALFFDVSDRFDWNTFPPLQPYNREFLLNLFNDNDLLRKDLVKLDESAKNSMDKIALFDCNKDQKACKETTKATTMESSIFTILTPNRGFHHELWLALSKGSIPVVLSLDVQLPFEAVSSTLVACLARKLALPQLPTRQTRSIPLFGESYLAPYQIPINQPNRLAEEEYLGPLEGRIKSPKYEHNFTSIQLYSKTIWSTGFSRLGAPEFLPFGFSLPYLKMTEVDTGLGLRPIAPGSGLEFKEALGGNYKREDFTIVMPSYNRDLVLEETLKKLHRLKNLNKVIVIWNSVDREPPTSWPLLHVPVEFIKPKTNSLNNRFLPWDRINTEAVLSMDDDIDIRKDEIDLAFRIWRENRDRIVGFPARFHAEFGDQLFYNSNKTCQYSMILTGYSFLHKAYLHMYSTVMHEDVRKHVDEVMNCEDIAMNFLVSSITQKPPLKVTTKWTLRCPTCNEKLSDDESHFNERHECIRLFTKIFGHNPLKNSQYRADSVLFKTRVEGNAQKCYNAV